MMLQFIQVVAHSCGSLFSSHRNITVRKKQGTWFQHLLNDALDVI